MAEKLGDWVSVLAAPLRGSIGKSRRCRIKGPSTGFGDICGLSETRVTLSIVWLKQCAYHEQLSGIRKEELRASVE